MKNNLLKRLAEKARNRMLGKNIYKNSESVCVRAIADEDADFNLRAREVFLKSEADSSYNPIKMLMDEKVLIKLDSRGREKYLLETIEKYLKAKLTFLRNGEFV